VKALLPVVGLLILVAACGSSGKDLAEVGEEVAEATATATAEPYPPNDSAALAEIIDPIVEPYGLRFTYGSLNDTSDGGYEPSDTGNHLALYVEPTGDYSDEDYINGLFTISAAVTPYVFETWEGLTSYDICQEPRPTDDDSAVPPPATQINIERAAAESYDWANGDLESMLVHAEVVGGDAFALVVAPPYNSVPLFVELAERVFGT